MESCARNVVLVQFLTLGVDELALVPVLVAVVGEHLGDEVDGGFGLWVAEPGAGVEGVVAAAGFGLFGPRGFRRGRRWVRVGGRRGRVGAGLSFGVLILRSRRRLSERGYRGIVDRARRVPLRFAAAAAGAGIRPPLLLRGRGRVPLDELGGIVRPAHRHQIFAHLLAVLYERADVGIVAVERARCVSEDLDVERALGGLEDRP